MYRFRVFLDHHESFSSEEYPVSNQTPVRALAALMDAGMAGEVDRRTLLKLAGSAAAASGLAMTFPQGLRTTASAQAQDNVFIYGSGQDISNLDPHTGSDYSI